MTKNATTVRISDPDDLGVARVSMLGGAENYLSVFLLRELADALEALSARTDCGAIVVGSEGKHFCAGRDWRVARHPEDTADAIYACVSRLVGTDKPWIAELTGGSIGVGMGVAMCADYRVAADSAYLWPKFVSLGIHHGFGLTATLTAAVGSQRATQLVSTGRRISMREAERIGLVDVVAPLSSVDSASEEFAQALAAQPRLALASIRKTMRAPLREAVDAAIIVERAAQAQLYESTDFQQATGGGYRYESR